MHNWVSDRYCAWIQAKILRLVSVPDLPESVQFECHVSIESFEQEGYEREERQPKRTSGYGEPNTELPRSNPKAIEIERG